VVAHDAEGAAGAHQGSDELGDFEAVGAAVGEVAQKDRQAAVGVMPAVVDSVAEVAAQGDQGGELAVDVADEVEGGGMG
jgi:hypothetical protein